MAGGMQDIMRQAQQMQKKISEIQEEVGEQEFEASTGGGVVTATVNGDQDLLGVDIDPDVMGEDDPEMLEEMIVGAVNQALQKAEDKMNEEIEQVTGGMDLPGGMGGMF